MNDFKKRIIVDVTGEKRREEVEEKLIQDDLERTIKEWELMNSQNITRERKIVEEIVKIYKVIINSGADYDEKEFESHQKRLETLRQKELEYRYRMFDEDESCKDLREKEILEGEEIE